MVQFAHKTLNVYQESIRFDRASTSIYRLQLPFLGLLRC